MRSQDNSAAVVAKARYLVSMEEQETVGCFLEDQEIGQGPRKTRRPVVEQQSEGSLAQSASEKAVRESNCRHNVAPQFNQFLTFQQSQSNFTSTIHFCQS